MVETSRLDAREGLDRLYDYWSTVLKRTWRGSVAGAFLSPVLYVVAMGVLLGGFIEGDPDKLEGASSYLAFVVPGLIASHAMQQAVGDMTYPVIGQVKWTKGYHAMLATPLRVADVVTAHLLFVCFRVAISCAVFMLVLAPFGVFATWWGALLAFGAQVLTGAAFAAVTYGFSAGLRNEQPLSLVFRFGVFPLFLFSGAFFPISNLGSMEWAARVTPLWHGVNLSRMLTLDTVDLPLAVLHVFVLGAMVAVGWWWAVGRLTRRLVI